MPGQDNIKFDYHDSTTRHPITRAQPETRVIALGQTRVEERTHVSDVESNIGLQTAQIDSQLRVNLGLDRVIWQPKKHRSSALQRSQHYQQKEGQLLQERRLGRRFEKDMG